jgi:nucleoside-diphosphate-sugar epimerase
MTGSNGFIGKNLVQKLRQLNYSVIEFSGDILEEESYRKLHKEDITHCFHLAAKSFVPESWNSPDAFIETNVYGTEKVLEFCRQKSIPLTFISSYLYGSPKYLPINEQHPLQTPNPYALSKHMAEELCRFYSEYYKMKICIIRPFNIYGPAQDKRFLIPELIGKFQGSDKEVRVKDLEPKRDYVYISDLVEALVLTLKVSEEFLILNIGSGYSLSVAEITEKIKSISGSTKNIVSSNEKRVNEIPDTVADIKLAFEKLGWKSKISFEEGINEILKSKK